MAVQYHCHVSQSVSLKDLDGELEELGLRAEISR